MLIKQRLSNGVWLIKRPTRPVKEVVEPNFNRVDCESIIQIGGVAETAVEVIAVEIKMKILDFHGPPWIEHIFNPRASCPTRECPAVLTNVIEAVGYADTTGKKCKTGLAIDQGIVDDKAASGRNIAVPAAVAGNLQRSQRSRGVNESPRSTDVETPKVRLEAIKKISGLEIISALQPSKNARAIDTSVDQYASGCCA